MVCPVQRFQRSRRVFGGCKAGARRRCFFFFFFFESECGGLHKILGGVRKSRDGGGGAEKSVKVQR